MSNCPGYRLLRAVQHRSKLFQGRMMTVAVHELGKESVLLEETAEAPGFKLKPAVSHPVGSSQDEEFWNTYQVLQQLSRNTH